MDIATPMRVTADKVFSSSGGTETSTGLGSYK